MRKQMTTKSLLQKIPVSIFAGLGISLVFISIANLGVDRSISVAPVANRTLDLPTLAPIVSSESTANPADLSTTAKVATKEQQPVRINSAQIALSEARVAVALSQVQLDRARTNLIEFQAHHNSAKILSEQGKVSRQRLDTAKAAHELAKLQHSSASLGLQESTAQLFASKAEVCRLGRKANPGKAI